MSMKKILNHVQVAVEYVGRKSEQYNNFIEEVIEKIDGMYKMRFTTTNGQKYLFKDIDYVDVIKVNIIVICQSNKLQIIKGLHNSGK